MIPLTKAGRPDVGRYLDEREAAHADLLLRLPATAEGAQIVADWLTGEGREAWLPVLRGDAKGTWLRGESRG